MYRLRLWCSEGIILASIPAIRILSAMIEFPIFNNVASIPISAGSEDEAWNKIRDAAHFLTPQAVKNLRFGLDGFAKSILVEPFYVCHDYRNLYSHYLSKKFRPRETYCNRIHFFDRSDVSYESAFVQPGEHADSYLGYSVIQPIAGLGCIGRTLINPMKIGNDPESFFCLTTKFRSSIMGADYHVTGYPYTAQTAEATVCAHSALWGVCRYLSERYNLYSETYPYDLIQLTGNTHGRTVPYRGMTYSDYLQILASFGCHPVFVKPNTESKKPDWKNDPDSFCDIYAYSESGFPVLASLNGHVITVIGHTLRDDLPKYPYKDRNGWIDSFNLVKEFVVVDDNFFPYQKFGFKGSEPYYGDAYPTLKPSPSIDSIYAAVIPLPEKAFLPVEKARALAKKYLAENEVQALLQQALTSLGLNKKEPIISRLYLTSGSSFKRRKRDFLLAEEDDAAASAYAFSTKFNLPHFVWVMELAPLTLWKKRRCTAEVILDSTICMGESQAIYIRVGDAFFYDGKKILPKTENGSTLSCNDFQMYTHNLGER